MEQGSIFCDNNNCLCLNLETEYWCFKIFCNDDFIFGHAENDY